jgi:hypothetical protein
VHEMEGIEGGAVYKSRLRSCKQKQKMNTVELQPDAMELQPDAMDKLFEMMLEDELVRFRAEEFYHIDTQCFYHSFYDLKMECVKAALVCTKWNQAYKACRERYFEKEAAKIRQTAVQRALAMCELSRYEVDDARDMDELTQELHEVQLKICDRLTLSMVTLQLTRWDAGDGSLQRLIVQYRAGAQAIGGEPETLEYFLGKPGHDLDMLMPARVEPIPQECFEDPAKHTLAQRNMIEKWKADFAEATALWLPTQRDAEGQEAELAAWRRDFSASLQDLRVVTDNEDSDEEPDAE